MAERSITSMHMASTRNSWYDELEVPLANRGSLGDSPVVRGVSLRRGVSPDAWGVRPHWQGDHVNMGWLEVLELTGFAWLPHIATYCHHLGKELNIVEKRTSRYFHLSDFVILAEACNPALHLLRLTLSKLDMPWIWWIWGRERQPWIERRKFRRPVIFLWDADVWDMMWGIFRSGISYPATLSGHLHVSVANSQREDRHPYHAKYCWHLLPLLKDRQCQDVPTQWPWCGVEIWIWKWQRALSTSSNALSRNVRTESAQNSLGKIWKNRQLLKS